MAPIKFEEQIKDKLEQRTVTPSAEAWSKLSEQLDADHKRSKKASFWWFGIAASIAALIFVSISYFGQQDETSIDNSIVKDEIKNIIQPKAEEKVIDINKTVTEDIVAIEKDDAIKEVETQTEAPKTVIKKNVNQVKTINKVILKSVTNDVAKVEKQVPQRTDNLELKKTPQELMTPKLEVELNSVASVMQEVKSKNKNTVTDQQIDSLLKVANRELLIDKAVKKSSNIVNADALLQDVEEAMGESFRTRIYETLKDNYKKVKTAVAQRNN
ncbi:hypothetical protein [Winogradskyella haliclonae]|uniref:Anti-sigma factor n=1 Tax=Winogradskyella haliclonae TaxID=2048558 RepID=A0ABQ2BTJ2_9FLAO|nr:hypothetical protein [Winogradskyella haliclonae]GGI55770.1 hypothetical protein GCM10011444_00790 [Winogradskyella haliclonae]